MSKTCPNCWVNSPDNAKYCIECGENIEDVEINIEKKKPKAENKSDDDSGSGLGCIIMIAVVVILIVTDSIPVSSVETPEILNDLPAAVELLI